MAKAESQLAGPVSEGPSPNRIWVGLGLFAIGSLVGGALVAPPLHRLLMWVGRRAPVADSLRDLEFESVAARCVMILAVLLVFPLLRWTGVTRVSDIGLSFERSSVRRVGLGLLLGIGSMAPVVGAGFASGVYRSLAPGAADVLLGILLILPVAFLVAAIEEVLFRGLFYGLPRRGEGVLGAAVFSSVAFSLIHFARPEPVIGVAHAHWDAGLRLVPDTFRFIHGAAHYLPFMVTLFLMGLCLCLLYEMTGSLWVSIGVHAGWIIVLLGMDTAVAFEPGPSGTWFAEGTELAKSYAALVAVLVMAAACLAVWRYTIRGREP